MSPQVVARWAGTHRDGRPVLCSECGEPVAAGGRCDGCYQLAPGRVGMLAAVVDTPTGTRLVIAERDPASGRWMPTRAVPVTGEAVRMVRRAALADGTDDDAAEQLLTGRPPAAPEYLGRFL